MIITTNPNPARTRKPITAVSKTHAAKIKLADDHLATDRLLRFFFSRQLRIAMAGMTSGATKTVIQTSQRKLSILRVPTPSAWASAGANPIAEIRYTGFVLLPNFIMHHQN
jgi:hypothetical protein